MLALLIFILGSLICAVSPTSAIFILGRIVSGVAAAAIFAGGMVIVQLAVPMRKIALYVSLLSSMYGVAALSGPPLGGVFTGSKRLTWRFCFWLNLRKSRLSAPESILTELTLRSVWRPGDSDDDDCFSRAEERSCETYAQGEDPEIGYTRHCTLHREYCLFVPGATVGWKHNILVQFEGLGAVARIWTATHRFRRPSIPSR